MLQLRVKKLMKEKGIKAPLTAMMKAGISQGVAQKYLSNKKIWILYEHIEMLCLLLRCEPNDLFEFVPDGKTVVDEAQPLNKLKPKPDFDVNAVLQRMTPDEIRQKLG